VIRLKAFRASGFASCQSDVDKWQRWRPDYRPPTHVFDPVTDENPYSLKAKRKPGESSGTRMTEKTTDE